MKRRTLIRFLVGVGIGIPILVELLTFAGMLDRSLLTDGDGSSPTPEPRRVGEGDELLRETAATETLTDAELRAGADRWTLTLSITVENSSQVDYELRLAGVKLSDGRTASGGATSGVLAPGEQATVTSTWRLPSGATPTGLVVVSVIGDGTPITREATVRLATIPVEGG